MDAPAAYHQEYNAPMANYEVKEVSFRHVPGLAQYKGSDYRNAVRVEREITVEQAKEIASKDPNIDYFVYTTGYMMVLEVPPEVKFDPANDPLNLAQKSGFVFDSGDRGFGWIRVFRHGDTVFFKNDGKWLGTAPGLADVYEVVR